MIKVLQIIESIDKINVHTSLINNNFLIDYLKDLKKILEKYPKITSSEVLFLNDFKAFVDFNLFDFKNDYLFTAEVLVDLLEQRNLENVLITTKLLVEKQEKISKEFQINKEIIEVIESIPKMNSYKLSQSTILEDLADNLRTDIEDKGIKFQALISDIKDVVNESLKLFDIVSK